MNLPDDCDRYSYDVMRYEPPRLRYWCALVGADEYKARCDRPDSSFRSSQCHFLTLPIKSNFTLFMHIIYDHWISLSASFHLNSGMTSNLA